MIDVDLVVYAIGVLVPFGLGMLVSRKVVSKDTLLRDLAYVERAVLAAEELYSNVPSSGKQKFDSAVTAVLSKLGVSEDEAETLVLSVVATLRKSGYLS